MVSSIDEPWQGRLTHWPVRACDAHEIVVGVTSSAVSYVDVLHARGGYQLRPQAPFVPGTGAAGTVLERGADVDWCRAGDLVAVQRPQGGCMAGRVIGDRSTSTLLPEGIDLPTLVAALEPWTTMHFAFTLRVRLQPADVVLVLGAGGAIGRAAVDIAASRGCFVVGAASSPGGRERASASGAARVVDSSTSDWPAAVRTDETPGVDVVVDPVGGDASLAALRLLRPGGRYAVLGFASGEIPRLGANRILIGNHSVVGVDYGDASRSAPGLRAAVLKEVVAAIAEGRYRPPAPRIAAMARAAEIFERVLDRAEPDRWVLRPDGS